MRLSILPIFLTAVSIPALTARGQQACVLNDADFKRVVLSDRPPEPTRLAVTPDGRALWTEKRGGVKIWLPQGNTVETALQLKVYLGSDNGLHGIALDPAFSTNGWVYLLYDPQFDDSPEGAGRWVSRFTLSGNRIDAASEKRVLHVRMEFNLGNGCCHQGGALTFDDKGNLYVSLGEESDYAPGIASFNETNPYQNALRSAGNTNDLRGKVLRIRPKPDGTYDIPDGNLFPKGADGSPALAKTRPEIYAMGFRNPYTMSYDARNGWLYVADVGMDHYTPEPDRGAVGYEEINLIRKASHMGYPFANGPNDLLRNYDSVNKQPLEWFDLDNLRNDSRYNTGLTDLRPAGRPVPALIYYTNRAMYSKDFPEMGEGRMAAMVGPTYRYQDSQASSVRFPAFLDGRLFFWDHERETVRVGEISPEGKVLKLERIFPNVPWRGITDMKFGPDGALYVIEYGHGFYRPNPEAKFSRVEYVGKPCGTPLPSLPRARVQASMRPFLRLVHDGGPAPLAVDLPGEAAGFDAYNVDGRRIWSHRVEAAKIGKGSGSGRRALIPAEALGHKGLVLIRFR